MQNILKQLPVRLMILLVWALFVLALTTQNEFTPLIQRLIDFTARTEVGAAIGHGGLFASLTGMAYLALSSTRIERSRALVLALALALLLGTATELYQGRVPHRASTLADLLANWLGVFVVGSVVSLGLVRSLQMKR